MNTPESDDDFVGVFIEPQEYVAGRKSLDTVKLCTNGSDSGIKNKAGDIDCTLYGLDKFIGLLQDNNPNVLELLFAPENCVVVKNEFGQRLVDAAPLITSLKCFHSFRGYAHSQKERLFLKSGNNTGRKELQEKYGYDIKLASHNLRLLMECLEILMEGKVTFPLAENKFLLDVKRGKLTLEEFVKESERLLAMVDKAYLNSKLQHSPQKEKIHKLQLSLYCDYWKSLAE